MNLEIIWSEIEKEQAWRVEEIHFFQNFLLNLKSEEERARYRRALILILYAHFEGFCKFAFIHYIKTINDMGINCNQVNFALAASALNDIFDSLRDNNKKCDLFRYSLPDDSRLHRFARDSEFIKNFNDVFSRNVSIPEKVVDTDSNLKPEILQKILFRLGLPHNKFDNIKNHIHKLLNFRNKISHGESKEGLSNEEYELLKKSVFFIMNEIKRDIMEFLSEKKYLR